MTTTARAAAQDAAGPAEIYDRCFVPALFAHWAPIVADAAGVGGGQRVLDVACGTGALTLHLVERVGPEGAVTGLDANPEMLAVARRKPARVAWIEGRAEQLPFPDGSFDAVASQFGMMFFDDPAQALREMHRVLRPGGRLAVAVCDVIEASPGYSALAALLDRLFGRSVGDALRAPFVLGDRERLGAIAAQAGLPGAEVAAASQTVRFASIGDLVSTERACVWTLGGLLDDRQFDQLLEAAESELRPFVTPEGSLEFEMPALILEASRRG